MSLRELCRRHGVTAHSAVVVQARQGDWAEKRRTYRFRASATYIQHHADYFLVALVLVAGGALLTLLGQRGRAGSAG